MLEQLNSEVPLAVSSPPDPKTPRRFYGLPSIPTLGVRVSPQELEEALHRGCERARETYLRVLNQAVKEGYRFRVRDVAAGSEMRTNSP
jgi:hypothetical protein